MPFRHFKTRLSLLIILCVSIFAACQKKHSPWDAGTPESNRLMHAFDSVYSYSKTFRDTAAMRALADKMEVLAKTDSLSKARWYYINMEIAYAINNDSLTLLYTKKGRALLDSARYPYETARFIYHTSYFGKTASDKYMRVAGPLKVFEEYNDSINIASSYMSLGALLSVLHDYDNALKYSQKSHDMYNRMGDKRATYRLSRNIAHILICLDRNEEAYRICDSMRRDPGFGVDNAVDCLVLSNIYDSTKNVTLLRQGLEIAERLLDHVPEALSPVPYISAKLGRYYLKAGRLDSAEYYAPSVMRALEDGRNTYDDMYLLKAELAEAKGDIHTAQATRTLLKGIQAEERKSKQIADAEGNMELDRVKQFNATLADEKAAISLKATLWIVLAVVLAAIIAWVIVRRVRRHSASRISELNDDLSRSSSELAVAHLKNAEKERVLTQALSDVKEINKENADARTMSSKIASDIARAVDSKSDWEKFEITFNSSYPGFVTALRDRNPSLTKGDVRLACMIAMGMDNKHISRVLAINVDSVKKNRQRLRAKLQLDADTTLPEFLATLKQG